MKRLIKGMLVISILSQLVSGCALSEYKSNNITKFEWDATDSGPEHYPMEIIKGTFIYKGETHRGLYIPNGGTLVDGWGDPVSSHVTGEKYKPLPAVLALGSDQANPMKTLALKLIISEYTGLKGPF